MFKLLAASSLAALACFSTFSPVLAKDNGIAYALHAVRAEKGRICMTGHFHHGKSQGAFASRKQALKSAVHHWTSFTALEYGSDWGSFKKASQQGIDCEKASRSTWTCAVKARPCRQGVNMARR